MYKTSTFLTSLFSKFHVRDPKIRKQVTDLYRPIIETILSDAPASKRVIIFKELLPAVQVTISYLEELNASDSSGTIAECSYQALKSSVAFCDHLIKKVGIRSDSPNTFSDIMKQVNLEEIACDIGECISVLKVITDDQERADVNSRLQVLLSDYNLVTGQELTVEAILCHHRTIDHEL